MSYAMGQIVAGLLTAWAFGFMLGLLWRFFMEIINAVTSKESE
jgi:tetrahydromethanopterin S-methyltransferase subunit B